MEGTEQEPTLSSASFPPPEQALGAPCPWGVAELPGQAGSPGTEGPARSGVSDFLEGELPAEGPDSTSTPSALPLRCSHHRTSSLRLQPGRGPVTRAGVGTRGTESSVEGDPNKRSRQRVGSRLLAAHIWPPRVLQENGDDRWHLGHTVRSATPQLE